MALIDQPFRRLGIKQLNFYRLSIATKLIKIPSVMNELIFVSETNEFRVKSTTHISVGGVVSEYRH